MGLSFGASAAAGAAAGACAAACFSGSALLQAVRIGAALRATPRANADLRKLKPDYKGEASIHDVAENPRGVKLVELEAAQLPISLQDLDVACVPMNYAVSGGLDVNKQGFYFESRDAKYALIIIAARPDNVQSPEVQTFVKCYQSPEVAAFIKEKFKGQINPAWEQPAK